MERVSLYPWRENSPEVSNHMSKNVVADFGAFVSVTVDGETAFETRDGRIVMTRTGIVVAGESSKQKLRLDSLMEFDFRTVPPEWEQFFDDLVGIRFDEDGSEYVVTVGTDTAVADRFVTVLLKLLLDDTMAGIRQRTAPLADDADGETSAAETAVTLLPQSERISFDDDDLHALDIETVTGVSDTDEGILVRHLYDGGRVTTEITPETDRGAKFLRTYLDFRGEISSGSGPVRFLFVGEDRDALVLIAKLLNHRNLAFEAAHAESGEQALAALDEAEEPMECLVSAYELADMTGPELQEKLAADGYDHPIVFFAREMPDERPATDEPVVDVVELGSRTEHYEDIADAIERAVLAARVR